MFFKRNQILSSNRTRKALATCVVLLSVVFVVNAQKNDITKIELNTSSNSINYKIPGKQFYAKYIPSGSDFLYDEWKMGYVILENGDKYDDIHLKYNTLNDELITLNGRTNTLIMIDKDAVQEFGIYSDSGLTQRFKKYKFEKGTKDHLYFNVLYEGNLKVVIWQRTIEEKISPYRDKNGYLQVSEFNLRPQNYVGFPDGEFKRFRFTRVSFFSLFADKKQEIRRLLRQNKNHLRTNADYIEAVKLIESKFYSN